MLLKQKILDNNPNITFKDLDGELKTTQSKITYICSKHGEATKRANELSLGKGYTKCLREATNIKKTMTTEKFIQKSKIKHGDKYDYSKTIYTGSFDYVTIACPVHGEFNQLAVYHMTKGYGCKKCGQIETAKKSYLSAATFDFTTLYYIKCYGKGEVFYKIGITTDSVKNRYPNQEAMPYLFEVLREIRGNVEQLLEIEKSIKLAIEIYNPKIPFNGSSTECTLNEIDINNYLT